MYVLYLINLPKHIITNDTCEILLKLNTVGKLSTYVSCRFSLSALFIEVCVYTYNYKNEQNLHTVILTLRPFSNIQLRYPICKIQISNPICKRSTNILDVPRTPCIHTLIFLFDSSFFLHSFGISFSIHYTAFF